MKGRKKEREEEDVRFETKVYACVVGDRMARSGAHI